MADTPDKPAAEIRPPPENSPAASTNQQHSDPLDTLAPGATHPDSQAATHGESSSTGRRFRLVRPHAKGGLGEVFIAHDVELHRDVALKQIQGQHADKLESRLRFILEAEITGGLEHPGVVPVYGLGRDSQGRPFYAMRFINGDSLQDAIERFHGQQGAQAARNLALRKLLRRFLDVCNAVEYAHSRGVIHRDLKPANIMLGKFGETLVVDWGLAKALAAPPPGLPEQQDAAPAPPVSSVTAATQMGSVVGTPQYMSPEQAAGRVDDLGPASDVYSLGATLYCLLAGRPPVEGASLAEVLDNVRRGAVIPLGHGVPRPLVSICRRALARHAAQRYPSAKALADDVERWLADERVAAHRETLRERAGRWARTHRTAVSAAAALAATAVVALVVGLVAVSAEQHQTERQRQQADLARANEAQQRRAAETNLAAANEARQREHEALRAAELTLADMQTSFGLVAGGGQNPAQAILWFTQAAAKAAADPQREVLNRIRAQSWARKACAPLRTLRQAAQPTVLALHPGGRYLLVVDGQGRSAVWNLVPQPPELWPQGQQTVRAAAFSPDGELLALGSPDGQLQVIDMLSSRQLFDERLEKGISALAFTPGSHYLAVAGNVLRIWDRRKNRLSSGGLWHPSQVTRIAFGSDGRLVATACADGKARVFDLSARTAEPLFEPVADASANTREALPAQPLLFDADRQVVSIVSENRVAVRNAHTGELLREMASTRLRPARHLRLAPAGQYLAMLGFAGAEFWDLAAGTTVGDFMVHANNVRDAAFSRDGRRLLTGSMDRTVRLWSVPSGKPLMPPLAHQDEIALVALADDGQHFATAQVDGLVRLWRFPEGIPAARATLAPEAGRASYSRDGEYFVPVGRDVIRFGDNRALLGPMQTRAYRVRGAEPAGPVLATTGLVRAAAWFPDGDRLATLCAVAAEAVAEPTAPAALAGRLQVWDWHAGRELLQAPIDGDPVAAALSPDGGLLIAVAADGRVSFCDPESGRVLARHQHSARAGAHVPTHWVQFARDGRRCVVSGLGNAACLFDCQSLPPKTRPLPHDAFCYSTDFSPDGRLLATGSYDHALRLWDAATGELHMPPLAHPDWVFRVAFSPDGRYCATACRDHMARVWDCQTGRLASVPVEHDDEVFEVCFSPDGQWLATTGRDSTLRVWDWRSGKPVLPVQQVPSYYVRDLHFTADGRHLAMVALGAAVVFGVDDLSDTNRDELDVSRLRLWSELVSGQEVRGETGVGNLTAADWEDRWKRFVGVVPPGHRLLAYKPDEAAWHRARAQTTETLQEWESARSHLTWLIQAEPGTLSYRTRRGGALAAVGRWGEAIDDYSAALDEGEPAPALWQARGNAHAQLQHWDEAAADFEQAAQLAGAASAAWLRWTATLLAAGDQRAYRRNCDEMLRQFGETEQPADLVNLARAWCLSASPADGCEAIAERLEKAARAQPDNYDLRAARAAVLYHIGRFEACVAELEEAIGLQPREPVPGHSTAADGEDDLPRGGRAEHWLVLALAHHRLDNAAAASKWLAKAARWMDAALSPDGPLQDGKPMDWLDGLQQRLLRQEAEMLLGKSR